MSVKKIELIWQYQSIRPLVLKLRDRLVVALRQLSWVFSSSVFLAVSLSSQKTLDRVSADTPFGGAECVAPVVAVNILVAAACNSELLFSQSHRPHMIHTLLQLLQRTAPLQPEHLESPEKLLDQVLSLGHDIR